MSNEQAIIEAKRSLKADIKFLESLLNHIKRGEEPMLSRAGWTSWVLHNYISHNLMEDVLEAMGKNGK